MTGVSGLLMILSVCAPKCLFLPTQISPGLLNSIPMLAGLVWGLYSTRLMMMVWMLSLPMPVGVWQKWNLTTLPHKLEFLTLKWAVVQKFHEYIYGLTFDIYTDNNPLTYVLTTAQLNTASHWWVASLASYNFQLYYRAEKTNINVDALLRVSWQGCMPDISDSHIQVHWGGSASHAGGCSQRLHKPDQSL